VPSTGPGAWIAGQGGVGLSGGWFSIILRRAPGSTLIAIATLALGIAGTTTLFSFVNGVLLRPRPFPDADRLVQIWQIDPARPDVHIRATPANIIDWRAQANAFDSIGYATAWSGANSWGVIGPHGNERVAATFVSASLFRVYGVQPLLGRTFLDYEDEPGHAATVVISYRFWQRHFNGDPDVSGPHAPTTMCFHWVGPNWRVWPTSSTSTTATAANPTTIFLHCAGRFATGGAREARKAICAAGWIAVLATTDPFSFATLALSQVSRSAGWRGQRLQSFSVATGPRRGPCCCVCRRLRATKQSCATRSMN